MTIETGPKMVSKWRICSKCGGALDVELGTPPRLCGCNLKPPENVYHGYPQRTSQGGFLVTFNGEVFDPARSLRSVDHSPDGFAWGYHGSGPAQLALAILLQEGYIRDDHPLYYQDFKREVIAFLDGDKEWLMTSDEIDKAVQQIILDYQGAIG
jgi:hypothetical protein